MYFSTSQLLGKDSFSFCAPVSFTSCSSYGNIKYGNLFELAVSSTYIKYWIIIIGFLFKPENNIYVHDLLTFQQITTVSKAKGASLFTCDLQVRGRTQHHVSVLFVIKITFLCFFVDCLLILCYMQVAWVLAFFKISTYWMMLCLRQQFLM